MTRKTLIKRTLIAAGVVLFLAGLNHVLSYPMRFRNGSYEEWFGRGPAGPSLYRAYRFVDEEPVLKSAPHEEEAAAALSAAAWLTLNSPYGPNATTGRHENWLSGRPVLLAATPCVIFYRVKIPAKARLCFGIAVKDYLEGKLQNGARFIVEWRGREGTRRLFEESLLPEPDGFWEKTKKRRRFYHLYVRPKFGPLGDLYRDRAVYLSELAGEEGELRFITEPIVRDPSLPFAPAIWANPEIWAERPPGEPPSLNVLLFMIEATPWHMVEPYPTNPGVTPNIGKFARGAVVFEKFFTAGDSTNLSVFSFITGRHYLTLGFSHELYYLAPMVKARFYAHHFATLAEAMTRAGYRTAVFGTNHYFLSSRDFGLDLGFDQVEVQGRMLYAHHDTMLAVMKWLRENGSKPFFLHVHYDAPHDEERPFLEDLLRTARVHVPDKRFRYRKYLAQVMAADRDFAALMSALEELGIRDRTLVIVTADHGNCLDPAHDFGVLRTDREKPWRTPFQHGRAMSQEDIHIPFIVDWPPGSGQSRRIKTAASSLDLFPTLVDLLIPELPPDLAARMKDLDGMSLAPLLRGEASEKQPSPRSLYAISRGGYHLVVDGKFHYTRREEGFSRLLYPAAERLIVVRETLFDIDKDPRELHDLSRENPSLLARVKGEYEKAKPREEVFSFLFFNFDNARVSARLEFNEGAEPDFITFPGNRPRIPADKEEAGGEESGTVYRLEAELSGPTGIAADRPFLPVELMVNGEPVDLKKLRLGGFGLPLLAGSHDPDRDLAGPRLERLLLASRNPLRYMKDPGVYFYRMTFADYVSESFSDAMLSPAVRAVLKQWGYIE